MYIFVCIFAFAREMGILMNRNAPQPHHSLSFTHTQRSNRGAFVVVYFVHSKSAKTTTSTGNTRMYNVQQYLAEAVAVASQHQLIQVNGTPQT